MENLIKINTRDAGIFIFIGSFILGILIASFVSISFYTSLFTLFLSLAILMLERVYSRKTTKEVLLIALILLALSIGFLRYDYKNSRNIDQNIDSQIGNKVVLEGLVTNEPEKKDNSTKLIILPEGSKEKISISTDLYSHAYYGDKVKVSGKLQKPGIIKGDDGRNFDYGSYLSKDDIYYTISYAQVEILSSGNGNIVKASLFKIKNKFIEKIRSIFSEPEASLLAGLTLAGKDSLPKNILEDFRNAGIVHIVVLSGYNITIVAEFFLRIFSFLSIRIAAFSAAGSIILFTLMTGGQATVVRAAVMALILLLGKIIGRSYSAPRALLVAGFLMLLENPKILVFDPSFKLSFLATIALMFVVPIFEKSLYWVSERGGLKTILSTTLGTQIIVLPYILYTMGNFSLVALLSNILTLAIIPITMLIGFIATIIGFINNFIALPFAYVTHLFLHWILFVGEKLGNLSWGSFNVRSFPIWIMLVWYGVYIYIFLKIKLKTNITQNSILKNL